MLLFTGQRKDIAQWKLLLISFTFHFDTLSSELFVIPLLQATENLHRSFTAPKVLRIEANECVEEEQRHKGCV